MFHQLFKCPQAADRHFSSPLVEARLRFLTHCAGQGCALGTLRGKAAKLLVIVDQMDLQTEGRVSVEEIQAAADRWSCRQPQHHKTKDSRHSRAQFISLATQWLSFLSRLHIPAVSPRPYAHWIQEFTSHMHRDKGLSPLTIRTECRHVDEFLRRFCSEGRSLRDICIRHIDDAIARKGSQDGCQRVTIQCYASALRAFFRYAEMQGWCQQGLAAAIMAPRVFNDEMFPQAPSWEDVQRLFANTNGDCRADIRDRAMLMLFAVYGLRSGEVMRLQLEDLDWEKEMISVTRPKSRRTQLYPLSHGVGEAILRYLREVRPHCRSREVFLTLKAPFQPLSRSALWQAVSRRLRPLGIPIKHHGPHSLRHACATRLLAEGLSMKEIGDHLGHRDPDATRTYAKVDLVGLREVADFNLGGLL